MRKVRAVAIREYRANVRSKAFMIAACVMPLLMGGSVIVQGFMESRGDDSVKKVAVLDYSGKLFALLARDAEKRNEHDIFDEENGRQMLAKFELIEELGAIENREKRLLELSDRVRKEELFAIVEIGPDVLATDEGEGVDGAVRYYTDQAAYRDLPKWLSKRLNEHVRAVRFAEAGIDADVVAKAMAGVRLENLGLFTASASGVVKEAEEASAAKSFLIPFFAVMMMFMILLVTVQPMLNGVLEEKMQHIAEVLLGSMSPIRLMMGKLLGHVLVAITLLAIYLTGGYFVAQQFGYGDAISGTLVFWFVTFMVFGILTYGALYLAVGSCCNDVKEAQSLIFPVMLPMIIPMFCLVPIIQAPNGQLATALSLIPFTSPMVMVMRLAMPTSVAMWQPFVAMAGCLLASFVCVWAAGRIFRIGLLLQGKPPKMGEILRWIVRG